MTKNKLVDFDHFTPMPKRFMVWDKSPQKFYTEGEGKPFIFANVWALLQFLNEIQRFPEQLEIIQSTNLFDKNGKEIFEGGIVKWNEKVWLVFFHSRYATFNLRSFDGDGVLDYKHLETLNDKKEPYIEVIGHILSDPELLEWK